MPDRRAPALIALLAAMALAGCADDAQQPAVDDALGPALTATETTGVLRGLVVDQAIRPLANVSVTLSGPDVDRQAFTDADGFFGFAALPPGSYFVTAAKLAYGDVQQSTEVVAGVSEPPLVRLQLTFVPSEAPFVVALQRVAFVQCIVPGANACAIANLYPCALAGYCTPVVQDTSYVQVYDELMSAGRAPDWFQAEMAWDSTQSLSPDLAILSSAHSPDDGAGRDERQAAVSGPSPLTLTMDRAMGDEWELGTAEGTAYEIFGHMQATSAIGSAGFVLNQQVQFYFHAFYGYLPPEGWTLVADGSAPQPPQ